MLPGLGFAATHLVVSYRGSTAPQVLDVRLTLDEAPDVYHATVALPFLVEAVNLGAAGGAELPPSLGRAAIVAGPVGLERPAAPTALGWQIEVAAVSPTFVRTLIERLSDAGPGAAVSSMYVIGSLPVDGSPLSVREAQVRAWLDDPDARPGPFGEPPFPVEERPLLRGASIRLELARDVDLGLLLAFERLVEIWQQAILTFDSASLEYQGIADAAPRIGRGKRELAAAYDAFDFLRDPARATLLNMLTRFHEQVAPIERALVALS